MAMRMGAGERVDIPISDVPELYFHIRRRELGDDGGLTLELCTASSPGAVDDESVSGASEGTETALMRFDLFRDDPHYHVPASEPKPTHMEVGGTDAALEFTIDLLAERFPALLEQAGRADLAAAVAGSDVERMCSAIRSAAGEAKEPTEFRDVEVPGLADPST